MCENVKLRVSEVCQALVTNKNLVSIDTSARVAPGSHSEDWTIYQWWLMLHYVSSHYYPFAGLQLKLMSNFNVYTSSTSCMNCSTVCYVVLSNIVI